MGLWLHEFRGGFHQRGKVAWLHPVAFAILFNAGVVEHVLDQRTQPLALLQDKPEVFLLFFGGSDLASIEAFGHQLHRGDGRPQLMGNAGDEIALLLAEL